MKSADKLDRRIAEDHFIKRAPTYDRSASWVADPGLLSKIEELVGVKPTERLLDVAVGTGQVAAVFCGKAKLVVGIDICPQMTTRARQRDARIAVSTAERLPFCDEVFDACVCRQGLQFMDAAGALLEMRRVLKPGGRVVLAHLAAYGEEDKEATFLTQRLRNPARRNFFLPDDFHRLLSACGFRRVEIQERPTRESVNRWIDNGAIDGVRMEAIRQAYRGACEDFMKAHAVEFKDGDIFDSMNMVLARAEKERK